jgi:hypothetical protein
MEFQQKKGKKEKRRELVLFLFAGLDFALVKHLPESFATALIKPDCEFGSLATLVFPASHLPSLLRFADFLLALRTFSHSAHISKCYRVNGLKHFPSQKT